ncbi:MAG TPA: DUF4340 domain-containing protein [Vicinamibacterales bacterium]|nr:DUF4340 domain-containing protein [Vicinamibacterales bacterium]
MRSFRSTLVLLVVLAGLVGYIYYLNRKPEAPDTKKAFAKLNADDIDALRIRSADNQTTTLQKSGDDWKIVMPVTADADSNDVAGIAGSLATMDIDRVVDEKPGNLKEYGLDPARVQVEFRTKGQKDFRRLQIGDKTATGGDVYARLPGEQRVVLLNVSLDQAFDKNTFALREKKVLHFDRDKVDGLELASGSMDFAFREKDMEWSILKPIMGRGEYATLEGIVERLSTAQMQGIVADSATDLKQYGLDKPEATITVMTGGSPVTLMLGKTDNALVYAKDSTRPLIFTVAPTIKTDTFKDLGDFRRKDLFDSRSFTATHVEYKRGTETVTLDKSTGKDGKAIWKNAAGKTLDAEKVDDLLAKTTGLRADSYEQATNPALKMPGLVVTVKFPTNRTETVSFARQGTEVFAARADEPGMAKLAAAPMDDVIKALEAVK